MNHKLYNIAYSILLAAAICGGLLMLFGWMLCLTGFALAGFLTFIISFCGLVVTLVIEKEHINQNTK
jgi:hypothetical protein